jgi:hypothetical protein
MEPVQDVNWSVVSYDTDEISDLVDRPLKWSVYVLYECLEGEYLVIIPFHNCTAAGRADTLEQAVLEAERSASWMIHGRRVAP